MSKKLFNHSTHTKAGLTVTLLITGLVLSHSAQAGLLYNIVDLGTLGGISLGIAINASGQVVGTSRAADGQPHAFISHGGDPLVDLGIPGANSYGNGINASGQVTGNIANRAYIRNSNGTLLDLGTLGGNTSNGLDINDAGQVTGYAQTTDGSTHAFVTDTYGAMIDLGTLGGRNSYGSEINASGIVTGYSQIDSSATHAFVTDSNGAMIDLGTLGGSYSYGRGINASGIVTGEAQTTDGANHAFVTNNSGGLVDLGSLFGASHGQDINDLGQVVGDYSRFGSRRAFVTDQGVMQDLTGLLVAGTTDWVLTEAYGINNAGQITGAGDHNGLRHAFLLTPVTVPVPAAFWLMASGLLGLLGFNARRR